MKQIVSKYNSYRLNYQLFFSFEEFVSDAIDRINDISYIICNLLPNTSRATYHVDVVEDGVAITITTISEVDIPKLVNRLKTHSAKQFFLKNKGRGEQVNRKLWTRGYLLTTSGPLMDTHEGFEMLRAKNVQLTDGEK